MALLGLKATPAEIDRLFDIFDPDRSETIDYRELNNQLRKGVPSGAEEAAAAAATAEQTAAGARGWDLLLDRLISAPRNDVFLLQARPPRREPRRAGWPEAHA